MNNIKVNNISLDSLNSLIDLGYKVTLTQLAKKKPVYINYIYTKPFNKNTLQYNCVYKCVKPGCDHSYK